MRKTFKQFLEEGKKKKEKKEKERIANLQNKKGKLKKSEVMDILNSQGGIGAKAVKKYVEKNPNRGPIHDYPLDRS